MFFSAVGIRQTIYLLEQKGREFEMHLLEIISILDCYGREKIGAVELHN